MGATHSKGCNDLWLAQTRIGCLCLCLCCIRIQEVFAGAYFYFPLSWLSLREWKKVRDNGFLFVPLSDRQTWSWQGVAGKWSGRKG